MGRLKVSHVAARAGVFPSTVRFYMKLGLLHADGTTPGGYALFDEAAIARVTEIRRLQRDERLTLEEIAERLKTAA